MEMLDRFLYNCFAQLDNFCSFIDRLFERRKSEKRTTRRAKKKI